MSYDKYIILDTNKTNKFQTPWKMSCTRKSVEKTIDKEKFVPIDAFPLGKLPTLMEIVERHLSFEDFNTENTLTAVSTELYELLIK